MVKPKLAYIIHGIALGGAEVALLSALPALDNCYDLRVYVLGKSDKRLLGQIAPNVRQKMIFWEISPWLLFPCIPFIWCSLAKFRPAFIISSLWRSTILAVLYKTFSPQVKYFIMVHSTIFFHVMDRFFTKLGIRKSDAVFADSKATETFLEKIIRDNKRIEVLSYLTIPTPGKVNEQQFNTEFRFFYVGSLRAVKRVPLAIAAIAWLRSHGVDATLHIYGRPEGSERAIREEIATLNLHACVFLCGEVLPAEKGILYQQYNCYIQLSEHEGMAMSVVEAMQQGKLCFVTPVGEIPNYAVDGVSAVFLEVADHRVTEKSLQKMLTILKDENKCKSIAARAHHKFTGVSLFAGSLIEAIQKS